MLKVRNIIIIVNKMKKRCLAFLTFICIFQLVNCQTSQIPQLFNYQAAIRNGLGQIIQNTPVRLKISILDSTAIGPYLYSEFHNTQSSNFGLVNVSIGGGPVIAGSFTNILWGSAPKFVAVEVDINNTGNYTPISTTQLVSVPYALYAQSSGQSYTAGIGINLTGNQISAQTGSPLWNANQLFNAPISATLPLNNQFLMFDGTVWKAVGPPSINGNGSSGLTLLYTLKGF